MKKTLNLFSILVLCYLLVSCLAQAQLDHFYYKSKNATTYEFSAYVSNTGGHSINEYGVVWSTTNAKPTISDNKIISGTANFKKDESFTCTHTFDPGINFYCRAFVSDKKGTRYSETVHNLSTSYTGVITSMEPLEGSVGQEIKIHGKGFSPYNQDNVLHLSNSYYDFYLEVINSSSDLITAKVPNDTTYFVNRGCQNYAVSYNDSIYENLNFYLQPIYKFPVREGVVGTNITVYSYGPALVGYKLYLGTTLLTFGEWPAYPRQYGFKIPNVAPGVYTLTMVDPNGRQLKCGNELGNKFKVNP